jgi:hypothetical protein
MFKETFNPSAPEFKKVEDLPKEEQPNFENVEGGFVRKEAAEELKDAESIARLANEYKKSGGTAKGIHGNIKGTMKEIKKALTDDDTTATNILKNRALDEEFKSVDVLQQEANDIHENKYPEKVYLKRLKENPDEINKIPRSVWNNRLFALEAVKVNGRALGKIMHRHSKLSADAEIVLEAVRHDGLAIKYASFNFRNDKNIVLEAIRQNPAAFKYASRSIRNDIKKLVNE